MGVREIARRIGRDASTVSRERRRSRPPDDRDYDADPARARARAQERARRPRLTPLSTPDCARRCRPSSSRSRARSRSPAGWGHVPLLVAWHLCHETICECVAAVLR
ncbi:helix-turn-helix domain-containing protein [Actinomycetospora lutea]|uniref:helix-turn-helix domain-containing protein n=1 Tax=Actinomycetospora lutea TaxID=663604 RepID=UPI0023663479|nr:helix-turn-helix domain-containing protein [Actinomycetospora lutea]MDD7941054.1 helix-turn-helix domain-containing protein [Actinomycetospora lutea]